MSVYLIEWCPTNTIDNDTTLDNTTIPEMKYQPHLMVVDKGLKVRTRQQFPSQGNGALPRNTVL